MNLDWFFKIVIDWLPHFKLYKIIYFELWKEQIGLHIEIIVEKLWCTENANER